MSKTFNKTRHTESILKILHKHTDLNIGKRANVTEELLDLLRLEHRRGEYWRKKYLRLQEEVELQNESKESEALKCGNPNPPCSPNLKYGFLECSSCEWGE